MNYLVDRERTHHPGGTPPQEPVVPVVGKRTLAMDLPPMQLKREPGGAEAADAPSALPALPSGPGGTGQPLPAAVRAKMESSFGASFSAVRIHQDSHASALGALGYTQGNDIHFAPGQYQPDTPQGQELLGHELAHVVQQSQGRVQVAAQAKGLPINDDHGLEHEADVAGARAARGEAAGIGGAGATSGQAIQMSPGETIKQIMVALSVGAAVAGTIYWLLPVTVTTALVTGGLGALTEYWYGIVASQLGISTSSETGADKEMAKPKNKGKAKQEGEDDEKEHKHKGSETGGLGLGFGDLYEHEDAFGHKGKKGEKVKGNLEKFRTALHLTSLAPPLTQEQSTAALLLVTEPIGDLKKLDSSLEGEIADYGDKHKAFVTKLATVRKAGLTNLQISEFCGCYLRVIETLIGDDGSRPVVRKLAKEVDDRKPSSLSTSIVEAMYREKVIRSNLAGFSSDQLDWARNTSPILPPDLADEARKVTKEDLRNDDCKLWNVMDKTSARWTTAAVQISVWEVATLMHTPELATKTRFYNYNITDKQPNKEPLDPEWVFTGMKK
jgi:hypothetical protein